jgi:hypothetical protein
VALAVEVLRLKVQMEDHQHFLTLHQLVAVEVVLQK